MQFLLHEFFQAAAQTAETHDVRHRTVAAGAACAEAYRKLLEQVNMVGNILNKKLSLVPLLHKIL